MLSDVFGKTADLLDKKFLVGLLLPCLGFAAAVGGLVLAATGWTPALSLWENLATAQRWAVGGAATVVILVVAVLMGSQTDRLVGWWEGFTWPKPLQAPLVRRERRRWEKLDDFDSWQSTRKFREFPLKTDNLRPTRLGNAFLAAEDYSRERYGLDSVFFWPRLYLILPEEVRAMLDEARRAVDQFVMIATLALLTFFIAVGMGLTGTLPWLVWLPSAGGAALLAFLTYRSAVTATVAFGDLVRSVFDLYRRSLLATIGIAPPRKPEDERDLWKALGQFLFVADTDSDAVPIRYTQPAASQST